jgi:hypothetical protein
MRKTLAQKLLEQSTGRDIAELLRELYVDRRHSDREIGEALGVDRAVVQLWRSKYGITRDERPPVVIGPEAAA